MGVEMAIDQVIRARRTLKMFTGERLDKGLLREFINLAICAPNHHRNEPWRFVVVGGDDVADFVDALGQAIAKLPDHGRSTALGKKFLLQRDKLSKIGGFIYVTALIDADPVVHDENYAAACCAIHNMTLAAAARGLGSFWSTGELFALDICTDFFGIAREHERLVGALWLGRPHGEAIAPRFSVSGKLRFWSAGGIVSAGD